ncbi:MAG TPA: methyltransferase [Desulfonatronum sp.]|nr:methyltransferase [Desulfonatronum sp.]
MKLLGRNISLRELTNLLQEMPLEDLLDRVCASQEVDFAAVRVGSVVLDFLQLTDMERFIDQQFEHLETLEGADALPLWAKIWPACLPLAMYMQRQTPNEGDRVLEIGAGLGVAGLFAAHRGFPVVVTDNNPDALVFARINSLQNDLARNVEVRYMDFFDGKHQGQYSHIVGSEILYKEAFFAPLLHFFRAHLSPEPSSEIVLTADAGRRVLRFFVAAKEYFHIARSIVSRPEDRTSFQGSSPGTRPEPPKRQIFVFRMKHP